MNLEQAQHSWGLKTSEKVTMKRKISMVVVAGTVFAGAGLGCGGKGSFQSADVPELALEQPTNEFVITQMGPRNQDRTMGSLSLRNVGTGPMKITGFKWIEKPARLDAYHNGALSEQMEGQRCTSDGDCGEGGLCLTASGTCRDLGPPPTPVEVRPDALFNLQMVVTASSEPVQCPAPHGDVPDHIQSRYCGELLIETNANNDGQNVEDGNTRVYFVTDGSSGLMALDESYLSFTEVSAGGSVSREFTIRNEDSSPLRVERGTFQAHDAWFEIAPSLLNQVIDGHSSKTFTIRLEPPAGTPEEQLEFTTSLVFNSSSTGATPSIFIESTPGLGDVPQIEVNPGQLSFGDSSTQTLSIENHGGGALMIQRFQIEPASLASSYALSFGGSEISYGGASGIPNLGPAVNGVPEVREVQVTYTPPADPDVSPVGALIVRHNDTRSANPLRVMLLGEAADVALGEIGTNALRNVRVVADGGVQERRFPLYNHGNSPLTISGVTKEAQNQNSDEGDYSLSWADGPIQGGEVLEPGELRELVFEYAGDSAFQQHMLLRLDSDHDGQSGAMEIVAGGLIGGESSVMASITPSFSNQALVGEAATLTASVSGGSADLANGQWMILQRPSGSDLWVENVGGSITVVPDKAGVYRVLVQVTAESSREVQAVLEFEAVNN